MTRDPNPVYQSDEQIRDLVPGLAAAPAPPSEPRTTPDRIVELRYAFSRLLTKYQHENLDQDRRSLRKMYDDVLLAASRLPARPDAQNEVVNDSAPTGGERGR